MSSAINVAWVTGAGRGIGRSCALALAKDGHAVAVTARTTTDLASVVQACEGFGVGALSAPGDVTESATVRRLYKKITKKLGAPTVLVCAAGIARSAPILKTDEAFMERHWRLNVMGAFFPIQAALPAMLEKKTGRIVNIASVAALEGAPYIAAYAASKHALLGLTRSLAAELGEKGLRVNAVCPGYVDTRMTDENLALITRRTGLPRAKALARVLEASHQKRLIRPDEVAQVVLRLCQPDAPNGRAVVLDGEKVQW